MLLFLLVLFIGASKVATSKCVSNAYYLRCTSTCNISEISYEPSKLELDSTCSGHSNARLEITYTNSKYEHFTLQSAISSDIASYYGEISVTIKNSTINLLPTNAFPRIQYLYESVLVNYKGIFVGNTFRKVENNSFPEHATFDNNKLEILGHKIKYTPADGNPIQINRNKTQENQIIEMSKNINLLVLRSSNIESINQAFVDIHYLKELDLSDNNMKVIDVNTFTGLSNLEFLNLTGNQIKLLNKAFKVTKSLQMLNLRDNNLSEIDFNTFSGLSNLKNLDVSHNNISVINHAFIDLQNLHQLNVSHNEIKVCDFDTFTGLSQLMVLDLSHNEIIALDKTFPVNIPELTHFNISYNKLKTLNTAIFYELPQIQIIDINNNNFNCYQLITYTRFFIQNKIKSVKGTQRDGTHFQGILCNNATTIDYDDGNINTSNQIVDIRNKFDKIETITNNTREQVPILKDILKKLENALDKQIVDIPKNNVSAHTTEKLLTVNYLIVIMLFIILCLFVNILLYYNWNEIRNGLPCKEQNKPIDCEVEMNFNLL